MDYILTLLTDPAAWIAFATLVVMEIVLGIDNLIFIAILSNKLPAHQRHKARRIGISLALLLRLGLLGSIVWIVHLTEPVIMVADHPFSWRDMILIGGGLFLLWKATKEIHHKVDPDHADDLMDAPPRRGGLSAAVLQILMLDLVFSIDSIVTAVGMTDHLPIMAAAVIIAVTVMMLSAAPIANFINANPTIVILALSFLVMIGMTLIAEGFGAHVPKGYIYTAMAFSGGVETLNLLAKRAGKRQKAQKS